MKVIFTASCSQQPPLFTHDLSSRNDVCQPDHARAEPVDPRLRAENTLHNRGPRVERLLRLEALLQQVQRLEADGDDLELAEAYGTLAKHYLAHTLDEAARVAFANAQTLAPQDVRWTYYLAFVQARTGYHEASVASYQRVLELETDNLPTILHLGDVSLEMGENELAYDSFHRALEVNPNEAAAHAGVGKAAITLDRPQEAVEALRRALELQPQATSLHYQLALAYRKAGMVDEARAELELRGEVPVRFRDPLLNEIGPLQRGDLVAAVVEMAEKPDEIDDRSLADFAVGHLGSDPDAPQKLERAIASLSAQSRPAGSTVLARLHFVVAGLYLMRSNLDSSTSELSAALALEPDMTEAAILLGHISEQRGHLEEAVAVYSDVLSRHPNNSDALSARARTRLELADLEGAIEDFERLSAANPTDSSPLIRLAVAQARYGDLAAARVNYVKALALNPEPAEAAQVHHHLGIIKSQEGAIEEAITEFRAAVELDPALTAAGLDLAIALGNQALYEDAVAAYRQVLDRDATIVAAWLGMATALNLGGDAGGAVEILEDSWEQNPSSVELLHALARILASADDPAVRDGDRAVDLANRTFRAGTTVERIETLAMALAEAGRFPEAVKNQKAAISRAGWQGRSDLLPLLEANLERYQRGLTCCAEANPDESK